MVTPPSLDLATVVFCGTTTVRDCLLRWDPAEPFLIRVVLLGERSDPAVPQMPPAALVMAADTGAGVTLTFTRSQLEESFRSGGTDAVDRRIRLPHSQVVLVEQAGSVCGFNADHLRQMLDMVEVRMPLDAAIVDASGELQPHWFGG